MCKWQLVEVHRNTRIVCFECMQFKPNDYQSLAVTFVNGTCFHPDSSLFPEEAEVIDKMYSLWLLNKIVADDDVQVDTDT